MNIYLYVKTNKEVIFFYPAIRKGSFVVFHQVLRKAEFT